MPALLRLSRAGMRLKPPYSIDGWRFDVADVFARNDEVQDVQITLPLGALGASCSKGTTDIFGKELEYEKADNNSIALTVRAHHSYFMECQLK